MEILNTPTSFSIGRARAGVRAISAGDAHTMVVKADGTVWGTGWNDNGQLADGTTTTKKTFGEVWAATGQ